MCAAVRSWPHWGDFRCVVFQSVPGALPEKLCPQQLEARNVMSRDQQPRRSSYVAPPRRPRRADLKKTFAGFTTLLLTLGLLSLPSPALAANPATVDLKSAATFSAVASTYITLGANSTVNGDAAAGGAITEGAGARVGGNTHELNNPTAQRAIIDVIAARDNARDRTANPISGLLGGQTLLAGIHHSVAAFDLAASTTLTLDGRSDPNAVFILKTNGAIVTGASSQILLTNGARASNVFWQTPTHIVFGASSIFSGTLLASSYISFGAGAQLAGRALSGSYVSMGADASIVTSAPAIVPGAPTEVRATASNGQAAVSWTVPTSTGGSPISGYTVTSSPGGFTASTTGATTVTVPGLTNGTPYSFKVTATNAAGVSLVSTASAAVTPVTPVTPATAPGAPTRVGATAGNAQAAVLWTVPASNGGSPITGYTVTSFPGGFAAFAGGATASATVTGLSNGTAYTFTVTATNAAGTSAASAASAAVTPATAPRVSVDVPPSIAAGSPANGLVRTQYSSFTVPTSGFPSPTFAVTAGALPVGLVLSTSTGRITGTPTTAGRSTFTITASNGVGTPATATYTIVVRTPTVSLKLNFLPGSNLQDALATATASGFKVGSEYRIVMRSTPVVVHRGTVGFAGTVNWRGSLPTGIPAGAHSLTLHGVAPDGAALSAVAWFSYNASGEIVATSQIGPVPDPALGSMPDPVTADVPFLQDPIRAVLFDPITFTESSTDGILPTYPFKGWIDGGGIRDPGAVEFWMHPGLLTLLFTLLLLAVGWWWLIAARRRRRSEEEPEELPAGAATRV